MMDGRNCTGRKISLLNDISDVAVVPPRKIQLPPLHHSHSHSLSHSSSYSAARPRLHAHSHSHSLAHPTLLHDSSSSSCESTPSLAPQTPQLVRSSSSDSRNFATPSPLTPSYNSFDPAAQPADVHKAQQQPQHYYIRQSSFSGKMDDPLVSMYPPIPDATGIMPSAYPLPLQLQQTSPPQTSIIPQPQRMSSSPRSEPSHVSTVSAASNGGKSQPKKNQYPCPMAKQVGCTDFFTTSGHAARHAKKHTGKKDAFCPECNKAFTRKDNMEQHRRTHQNGRGSRSNNTTSGATTDDAKVKKSTKQSSKKSSVKVEPQQFEAALEQLVANQQPVLQAPMTQSLIPPPTTADVAQQLAIEQAMLMAPAGPYFVAGGLDTGPVPALPMAVPDLSLRPPLHRSSLATSLDYMPPIIPMAADPDMHYSYPSPGLSNGLSSLALAASEHRRLSEEKTAASGAPGAALQAPRSPQESPMQETPSSEGTTP